MMKIRLLAIIPALSLGGCYGLYGNDEMDRYFQRSDTITMSAGDAKQVNAVTHTINPWPRYVGDTRIAYDGQRVGASVKRYRDGTIPYDPMPNLPDPGKQMGAPHPPPPTTQNVNENINASGLSGAGVAIGAGK
jgi:hypothetical protein